MPWIQNVSLADVKKGHHIRVGENAMLIQIVDPDMEHPVPLHPFKEVHQFKFLDHVEVEKVMKVFAELIVRECCLLCLHDEDMDRIEKHFGIE